MSDSTSKFDALDRSIADTANQVKMSTRIHTRKRELLRENGLAYGYSQEEALEQATLEITGVHAKQAANGA